mmetsp:Transcript_100322/g.251521  ORF Transcript_100322/g.251521 Transcript_100322/m.251521 type:complete len:303 (-) Transcript_100322:612-1520(-)
MPLRQAASCDAADGPPMDSDVLEAAPPQEVNHSVPIASEGRWSWGALRTSEAAVIEQEHAATLTQVEVQPMGLISHRLIVGGVGVAPDDHRSQATVWLAADQLLEGHVLFRGAGRALGAFLVGQTVGRTLTSPTRDEHGVDFSATGCPDPIVVARVSHQQLRPQLVQGADRRHSHEAAGGHAEAVLLLLQAIQDFEELCDPVQTCKCICLGLVCQGRAGDREAHGHRHKPLGHPRKPVCERDQGFYLSSPLAYLRLPQPSLHALYEQAQPGLLFREADLVSLLHPEVPSQSLDDHTTEHGTL